MTPNARHFDPRILLLAAFGLFLLVVTWVASERDRSLSERVNVVPRRAVAAFRLYDQNSRLVNLAAYLNRHQIVLAFFPSHADESPDATIQLLQDHSSELQQAGYRVFGVTTALPQQNRAVYGNDFPFPLLTDPSADRPGSVHRTWGRLRAPGANHPKPVTIPAVFLIDRMGRVAWDDGLPQPIAAEADLVRQLVSEQD